MDRCIYLPYVGSVSHAGDRARILRETGPPPGSWILLDRHPVLCSELSADIWILGIHLFKILETMATKKTAARVKVPTKYYKATYVNNDGTREDEVYISDSYDSAVRYASGTNSYGRILERVQEYDELIEALL